MDNRIIFQMGETIFKNKKMRMHSYEFLGTSFNAVSSQIYIALISYLLNVMFRLTFNSQLSNLDSFRFIKHNLFQPIRNLRLFGYD